MMTYESNNTSLQEKSLITHKTIFFLVITWVLLTAPLIFLGYGSDPDAGRLAEAASNIWVSGTYIKSRSLGFPLYEVSITPLVHYGQWYLSNLVSMISALLIIITLIVQANRHRFKHPLVVIVCIIFAPIFVKNATSTMDYMAALSFLTIAYFAMLDRRFLLTAIMVGIAAGFRPTSGLFILPILVYMWASKEPIAKLIKTYFIALIIGALCYSPALVTYGLPKSPHLSMSLYSWLKIAVHSFLAFFGAFASALIYPYLLITLVKRYRQLTPFDLFHFVNIVLWVSIFFTMPYEPDHLLPILLSTILLLDRYMKPSQLVLLSTLLLSYHIVQIGFYSSDSGNRKIDLYMKAGYTVTDIRHRVFQNSLREVVTKYKPESPTVLTFGDTFIASANDQWDFNQETLTYSHTQYPIRILGKPVCEDLSNYKQLGYRVIVWNAMKADIIRCSNLKSDTQIIYNLSDFFGQKVVGKAQTQQ